MTEPEVAGSDPTLIQTNGYEDGDEWVINGHKWFISNARRSSFAILVCRTEENPEIPQAANSAFIIDLPQEGWNDVREVETMHGGTGHSEIVITDLRVHKRQMLGGRGQGHLLGQYRLGPALLAHCMRWIAQAETALDMMVDRSLKRYSHGSMLAEKQGIQWMIADSSMELYQSKLMVLHGASKIDAAHQQGDDTLAGHVSLTAPTRCIRCASPSGPSPLTPMKGRRDAAPATCRSEPDSGVPGDSDGVEAAVADVERPAICRVAGEQCETSDAFAAFPDRDESNLASVGKRDNVVVN
jgi:alkylation response protein AidB-like acyl-CoA dehydrogenase